MYFFETFDRIRGMKIFMDAIFSLLVVAVLIGESLVVFI
jgi:hypothetical protein